MSSWGSSREVPGEERPPLGVGVEHHLGLQRAADELVPARRLELLLHRRADREQPLEASPSAPGRAGRWRLGKPGEEHRGRAAGPAGSSQTSSAVKRGDGREQPGHVEQDAVEHRLRRSAAHGPPPSRCRAGPSRCRSAPRSGRSRRSRPARGRRGGTRTPRRPGAPGPPRRRAAPAPSGRAAAARPRARRPSPGRSRRGCSARSGGCCGSSGTPRRGSGGSAPRAGRRRGSRPPPPTAGRSPRRLLDELLRLDGVADGLRHLPRPRRRRRSRAVSTSR